MSRKSHATLLILVVFVICFPLRGSAANKEHLQMMADIRMLQEQAQQLQLLLGTLSEALKGVNAKIDEQSATSRKAFADQKLLIDNLGGDLRTVREKVDDTNVRISSMSQEVEALRLAIPTISRPSTTPDVGGNSLSPGIPPTPGGGAPGAASPSAEPVIGLPQSPQRAYDSAWSDYTSGQWDLAIAGFQSYIKAYPKSELADDAQFYIGEAFSAASKFKEAAEAYDLVIRDYPTGDKVPAANAGWRWSGSAKPRARGSHTNTSQRLIRATRRPCWPSRRSIA
jgi:TolA-binding protein